MSLQDSLFYEDVEYDVTVFSKEKRRKRVLVFPPVNSYRRFIIHQFVQDRFEDLLHTFSIGQGAERRTVVCYKSDVVRDPKLNGVECKTSPATKETDSFCGMGVDGRRSPSASPEHVRPQRQVKSVPAIEIYRPPAARKAKNNLQINSVEQIHVQPAVDSSSAKNNRQRRPDRAVYVPRHRRSLETDGSPSSSENSRPSRTRDSLTSSSSHGSLKLHSTPNLKEQVSPCTRQSADDLRKGSSSSKGCNLSVNTTIDPECEVNECPPVSVESNVSLDSSKTEVVAGCNDVCTEQLDKEINEVTENVPNVSLQAEESLKTEDGDERIEINQCQSLKTDQTSSEAPSEDKTSLVQIENVHIDNKQLEEINEFYENMSPPTAKDQKFDKLSREEIVNHKNKQITRENIVSDVLIISDTHKEGKKAKEVPIVPMTPPEKKVKKIERQKSKPAPPPSPPLKVNRDECDWDSLFDDNGDCLDPTLIEELTSAVGEVMIEQPKNDYKAYSKQVEVSSDEFAHVVEIYNFPSEFKTSDLAAVFSPFKNGGFELKWVDDTHCLGVFSSPLIAAEVLASDHPFVKTRPLSEATALSKTKARRSAEFLQPYRSRPETCAALARRLVTGALGVKLATARQEREHEKNVLREAKEKRRLANKQREDAWEGIIPEK